MLNGYFIASHNQTTGPFKPLTETMDAPQENIQINHYNFADHFSVSKDSQKTFQRPQVQKHCPQQLPTSCNQGHVCCWELIVGYTSK